MGERLKRWFGRPPADHPGEVLRWVRRVSAAVAILGLLAAVQIWIVDGSPPWALLAAFGLALLGAGTWGPAIRRADERGTVSDPDEQARMRRRGERAAWIYGSAMTIAFVVFGYIIDGVTGAIVFLFLALTGSAFGIWFTRRWSSQ